jgi:hypothetical protein
VPSAFQCQLEGGARADGPRRGAVATAQELRRAYEAAHGSDPSMWSTQHPGVVLGANAACLGCNWFHAGGRYRDDGVYEQHYKLASRHEASNGAFRGGDD